MQRQLSSPSTSYEFEYTPTNIYLRHPQTYAERLKVCVLPLSLTLFPDVPGPQSSKARIEALEAAEAARQETSLDWETRTRIARGASFPLYLSVHLMTDQRTRAPFLLSWIHPKGSVFPPQSCGPWISYVYHFWDNINRRLIDCVKQCRPFYLPGRCTALKLTASHSLWWRRSTRRRWILMPA